MTTKENESIEITPSAPLTTEDIRELILTVRGKQVLLDSDVARLYGYEVKRINETARRNIKRFPEHFRFRLTQSEADEILRSQIATSKDLPVSSNLTSQSAISSYSKDPRGPRHGGRRNLPYVYTEQGIGMLSGLLRNETAIQVSVGIMNAFVEMRQFISANRDVFANITHLNNRLTGIDGKLQEHDRKFDEVFDLLQAPTAIKQSIFFSGQFYDAFTLLVGLIQKAKKHITIIDNYADNSVLDMLANKNKKVAATIITVHPNKLSAQHLGKFAQQHGEVTIVKNKDFHDRFIIIDNTEVYLCGASLKDAGNKCFAVFKSEDTKQLLALVAKVSL